MALTPKQQRFVDEYLIDLNATAAYQRAGYKAKGRSAENAASRLLGNVGVSAAIEEAKAKRAKTAGIDAGWVLERLKKEAETEGKESSPAARVRALELLAKHLGMLTDRHEHTGRAGGPVVIVHRIAKQ